MGELILILIPILLIDLINPVLFGGVIYGLSSRHPVVNTWMILISFFLSYFLVGLLITVGLEYFISLFEIPPFFDYIIEFFVALLLFFFSWKMYRAGDQHLEEGLKKDRYMTFWDSILMGTTINLVGLPFALPYLAAIDQLLKAGLETLQIFFLLLLYNVAYILPFTAMIALRCIYKKESDLIFGNINLWVHRLSEKYLPILFLILGILLLEDCASYFLGYRIYSFLSLT